MYIVLGLNSDEFGRGNGRPVDKFETKEEMVEFLFRSHGANRFEVFEAKQIKIVLDTAEM